MRSRSVLAKLVTVDFANVSLESALQTVAASAKVRITYESPVVASVLTRVTLRTTSLRLDMVLDRILQGTGLRAEPLADDAVTIQPTGTTGTPIANGGVSGRISDAKTQLPIREVLVALDGASQGVMTGEDGTFRLTNVILGSHQLSVRRIGYLRVTKTVVVPDGPPVTVDVALEPSAKTLEQVIVTGTVIPMELKTVPNAITVITAKDIEQRGITKIDQLFRGDVPGLFVQNQGSNALLDEVTMYSRGVTSASRSDLQTVLKLGIDAKYTNPIKTYIDGVELADSRYLSQLDPQSIERIEILTGPQASTIYGSNAINGVMQIFTKRGMTSRPQLTVSLLSGWVENNFSSARTPQHDDVVQLNGVEGRMSYNGGGSWNYMGPWTPAKQMARTSVFGGTRLESLPALGRATVDVTLRRTLTQNQSHGDAQQTYTGYRETGFYKTSTSVGLTDPTTTSLIGQTSGIAFGYVPAAWWSHEVGWGQDAENVEARQTVVGNLVRSDTNLSLMQTRTERRTLRYATTIRVPVTSLAQVTMTAGADGWQNVTTSLTTLAPSLSGQLTDSCIQYGFICTSLQRLPDHNTGGFLQTQISVQDRLFFTYGVRAEWNPGFGAEATPNYAPRYGVAYTHDVGVVTAKLRTSYGRSTRPPGLSLKSAVSAAAQYGSNWNGLSDYGNFDFHLANPALGPESQQGGEGGLEFYIGTRGSLVVTRYNQTVDHLIEQPAVDSVRSKTVDPLSGADSYDAAGYGYDYQYQTLNVGSIRNQGWELQGSLNTGPFTTRGTYSWTKSRMIGVTPRYRSLFTANYYPMYQPGATFDFLPEHTWALGAAYVKARTTITLNVTGTGQLRYGSNDFFFRNFSSNIRLQTNRLRASGGSFILVNKGYAMVDFVASHRFIARMEGVFQAQNLTDHYVNDTDAQYPTIGRQVKAGLRWHL